MTPNDVLRGLRYALNLDDEGMARIFALAGPTIAPGDVRALLGKEGDPDTVPCSEAQLRQFLDGLILDRRGPPREGAPRAPLRPLTNNEILKKLRVGFSLMEADLVEILASVDQPMSKGELSALFRAPDHKHYRPCGDQVFRKFLRGLAQRERSA